MDIYAQFEALVKSKGFPLVGTNGHFNSGRQWELWGDDVLARNARALTTGMLRRVSQTDMEALVEAMTTGIANPSFIQINNYIGYRCTSCNASPGVEFNGVEVRMTSPQPCPYPHGHPPVTFDLPVPSGKIVVGDQDILDAFPISYGNMNTTQGQAETSQRYGEAGLIYGRAYKEKGRVGIYAAARAGRLYVGRPPQETVPSARKKKSVYDTYYMLCDYDALHRAAREQEVEVSDQLDIIKVRPGTYRVTLHVDWGDDKNPTFMEAVHISDDVVVGSTPTPEPAVEDPFLGCLMARLYRSYGFDPDRWEQFTDSEKVVALQQQMTGIFFVNGNGIEWNRKTGLPVIRVTEEARQMASDIASMWAQTSLVDHLSDDFHYYPFSKGYSLADDLATGKSKNAHPSVVRGCLDILRAYLVMPSRPDVIDSVYPPVYALHQWQERYEHAKEMYLQVAERYPDVQPHWHADFMAKIQAGEVVRPQHPTNPPWDGSPPPGWYAHLKRKYVHFDASQETNPRIRRSNGLYWASGAEALYVCLRKFDTASPDKFAYWSGGDATSILPPMFVAKVVPSLPGVWYLSGVPIRLETEDERFDKHIWILDSDVMSACRFFDDDDEYDRLKTNEGSQE